MELLQSPPERGIKDDKGCPLSEEAAIHVGNYRVRCLVCQKVFCGCCRADPYHLGLTCDQYKHSIQAVKCRFCGDEITGTRDSGKKTSTKLSKLV